MHAQLVSALTQGLLAVIIAWVTLSNKLCFWKTVFCVKADASGFNFGGIKYLKKSNGKNQGFPGILSQCSIL